MFLRRPRASARKGPRWPPPLFAGAARARGEDVASTTVDLAKYYEQITFSEVIDGALSVGIPRAVIALTVHFYCGPRRVRVGNAVSPTVYPRRSILPGCTWARVLIRAIALCPGLKLWRMLAVWSKDWEVRVRMVVYVDDIELTIAGSKRAVYLTLRWATDLLLRWINVGIRKRVAKGKLHCIASKGVREGLRHSLNHRGFTVGGEGELLGADFSAGDPLRKRKAQAGRIAKARARKGRLRWWRRIGGASHEVGRGGVVPQIAFGGACAGLAPRAMRAMRQLVGTTTRIRASGASLTAKLAIGGFAYADIDPAVSHANPPFAQLLAGRWDERNWRQDFIEAWRAAETEFRDCSESAAWRQVRGVVTAAWAHFKRVGIVWPSPFRIKVLDGSVDLLVTSPKHVMQTVRAHTRRHLDLMMVSRMMVQAGEGATYRRPSTNTVME